MKTIDLTNFATDFPAIRELQGYGIIVLTIGGDAVCSNCMGQGKDFERPCKPCAFCEGRGKMDVPLFLLGISEVPPLIDERHLSPVFERLDDLERFALKNKDRILKEEAARI